MIMKSYLPIISLNINGLNASTKSKDWPSRYKNKIPIYTVCKRHLKPRDTYRLKVRDLEKIFHANRDQK